MKKKIIFILVALLIVLIVWLGLNWNGEVKQFVDEEGNVVENSIATKEFIEVNGVKLGMRIQGNNVNNPVLLFLHGGPGMPEDFLQDSYPISLDEHFTIVWLNQRGAGLSFDSKIDLATINREQFIADDIEVAKYLCKRFNQEKIYLMAHSWGTTIGIGLAEQAPELFHAYIAMAQVTDQNESERLACEYMLDYYKQIGDKKSVKMLEEHDYTSKEYANKRDDLMHRAGIGTTRDMDSVVTGVCFASLKYKEYSIPEKMNLWRGRIFSRKGWELNGGHDAFTIENGMKVEIPVYFFSGIYDYTVNYNLAKEFYEQLDVPQKAFYTFYDSAHSPLFEEPDKALEIMTQDVLQGTTELAD